MASESEVEEVMDPTLTTAFFAVPPPPAGSATSKKSGKAVLKSLLDSGKSEVAQLVTLLLYSL